jgi:RNA polymerase sigma factor (sigma-70 family)
MDPVLLHYFSATDELERQERLAELVLLHAAPAVRHTLRQKFGFYVNQGGINPYNQDAEDLYQEAIARIVELLNKLRHSSSKGEIEHFRQYSSRVAINVCVNFLRAKSPARRRLKENVRLLLIRHSEFAIWKAGAVYFCGFASWAGNQTSSWQPDTSAMDEKTAQLRALGFSTNEIKRGSLTRIVREFFEWTRAPVELDTLVKTLAAVLNLTDHPLVSTDAQADSERYSGTIPIHNSQVEERETLGQLWEAVRRLPPPQRDAFCFGFQDEQGSDFFSLLIEAQVTTLPRLAESLARSAQEILRLRSQMPMDGATIAGELQASRAQVNKWRFLAVRRLRKELQPPLQQVK